MSAPVHVRAACGDDLPALAALFDQYRVFYGQPGDPGRAHAFLRERMQRGESMLLVAQAADGALMGFTQLYPLFSSVAAARIYLLNDLFVADAFRRLGVGRALLECAAQFGRCAGARRLLLSTAVDNAPARALYESLGWTADRSFVEYALDLETTASP